MSESDKYTIRFLFSSEGVENIQKKLGSVKKQIDDLARPIGQMGLALTGAATGAVAAYAQVENSLSKIRGLVGLSAQEMEGWGSQLQDMALATGQSTAAMAEGMFFVTSAGLRGSEAMDVLEASARAATAGLGDVSTLADLATSAVNAYGSAVLPPAAAMDHLTEAVRLGKLEADQLAGAMGNVLPIASNMGVTFGEVSGIMAAMSKTGTDAANGATQLNAVMAGLLKPSVGAAKALASVGLNAEQVQESIRTDGLMSTLVDLREVFGGNTLALERLFPNIRALKGVLDLLGTGMEGNIVTIEEMRDSTGTLDEAFLAASQTINFNFRSAMVGLTNVAITIGEALAPAANAVLQLTTELAAGAKSLIENSALVKGFTRVVLIAGPALLGFAGALKAVSFGLGLMKTLLPIVTNLSKHFGRVSAAAAKMSAAGWISARAAMVAAMVGIPALIAGITLLVSWLAKKFDWVEKLKTAWYQLTGQTEKYLEAKLRLKGLDDGERLDVLRQEHDLIKRQKAEILKQASALRQDRASRAKLSLLQNRFNKLLETEADIRNSIANIEGAASAGAPTPQDETVGVSTHMLLTGRKTWASKVESGLKKISPQLIEAEIKPVIGEMDGLNLEGFKIAVQDKFAGLKNFGKTLGADLLSGMDSSLAAGKGLMETLKGALGTAAKSGLAAGLTALTGGIIPPGIANSIAGIGVTLGKRLGKNIGVGIKAVANAIYDAITFIFQGIKKLFQVFTSWVGKAFKAVTAPIRFLLKGIRKLLPKSDAEEGPLSDLSASGRAFATTFAGGIKAGMGSVGAAALSVAEQARRAMDGPAMRPVIEAVTDPSSQPYALLGGGVPTSSTLPGQAPSGGVQIHGNVTIQVDGGGKDPRQIAEEVYRRLQQIDIENSVDQFYSSQRL